MKGEFYQLKKVFVSVLTLVLLLGAFIGQASAATDFKQFTNDLVGTKYQYGGTTTKGFDCSGFTSYVMKEFNVELNRVSRDQFNQGTKVKIDQLRLGDLVFFNTSGKGISHVGIYLEDNKFIHSSSSHGVRVSDMSASYYNTRYVGATRVIDDEKYATLIPSETN